MMSAPTVLKTSWSLLITGISASMALKTSGPPPGWPRQWMGTQPGISSILKVTLLSPLSHTCPEAHDCQ
jgi:hypothetical protein